MMHLMQMGGPAMWILLIGSILGAYVFLERMFHYHRAQVNTRDFLDGVFNVLRRGNVAEAVTICEDSPGPVPHIVRAALLKADDEPEDFALAIQQAGLSEIPRLEHRMGMLATVARLSTQIGLLGTMLGMMASSWALSKAAPLAHIGDLSEGLYQALITTCTGLSISIVAYAGYNLLVGRMDALLRDMEQTAAETYSFLLRRYRRHKQLSQEPEG